MSLDQMPEAQRDALREVSNIGVGHAATALSKMIGRPIEIFVPRILITPLAEVPVCLGGAENMMAGIFLGIQGDARGSIMMLFPKASAVRLCGLLTGEELIRLEDQETVSSLKEVGNILASAYLNALGELIGKTLLPSVPCFAYDMAGALVDTLLIEVGRKSDLALMVETEFGGEFGGDASIRGHFFLIPDPDTYATFFSLPSGAAI